MKGEKKPHPFTSIIKNNLHWINPRKAYSYRLVILQKSHGCLRKITFFSPFLSFCSCKKKRTIF